jgi:hypothetical protein
MRQGPRTVTFVTIPNASVRFDVGNIGEDLELQGVTDTNGHIHFREVPNVLVASHYWITAAGYEPYESRIDLPAGDLQHTVPALTKVTY